MNWKWWNMESLRICSKQTHGRISKFSRNKSFNSLIGGWGRQFGQVGAIPRFLVLQIIVVNRNQYGEADGNAVVSFEGVKQIKQLLSEMRNRTILVWCFLTLCERQHIMRCSNTINGEINTKATKTWMRWGSLVLAFLTFNLKITNKT